MRGLKRITAVLMILCMLSVTGFAAEKSTSKDFRYPSSYNDAKKQYSDFSETINDKYSVTAIPGLERTVFPGGDECSDMTPQGICFAGSYMLISAYDGVKEHNSVIYVVSMKKPRNPQFKGMIVLPDDNHSGGICFDGENVWMARSTEKQIASFGIDTVINAAEKGFAYVENFDRVIDCETNASFLTYYNGLIWVGLFDQKENGVLKGYSVSGDSMSQKKEFVIPAKSQGASFTYYGGKTFLAVSSSYGRKNNSKLYIYEADLNSATLKEIKQLTYPPLMEEVEFFGSSLYTMFESAATQFNAEESKCEYPIDRVCAAEKSKILDSISFIQKIIEAFRTLFSRMGEIFGA